MAFTYFFRDIQTLEVAIEYLIPAVMGRKYIRIWDAGCAMGPEPYTLAIMLAEKMGKFAFRNMHIDATDIDGSNLFGEIISNGVYPEDQLRRIPSEIFSKYFVADSNPGHFKIVDKIRSRLSFQKHDLLSLEPIGENYSMIICKNVLFHLKEEDRILFAGDTSLIINSANDSYDKSFVQALEKICNRDIQAIYPGHGLPLFDKCNERLYTSLKNVKKSMNCGTLEQKTLNFD